MERQHNDHQVSTYINKRTGRVTEKHPDTIPTVQGGTSSDAAVDREIDDFLDHLNAPTVHCYLDTRTGANTSMSTNAHSYGGGFAVTMRQTKTVNSEIDASTFFDRTEISSVPHGVDHFFSLAYRNPSTTIDHPGGVDFTSNPPVENAIDTESLQQSHDHALSIAHLPIISPAHRRSTRRRNTRNKEIEPKLSEEQLFAKAIRLHSRRTAFLSHATSMNLYIRNHHLVTRNRTLAYTSAFLISERGPKAIFSVLWETKKKPHCAVSINLSMPAGYDSILAHCSCDYLITQTKHSQPSCEHAKVLFNDDNLIKQVTRELRRKQEATDLTGGGFIFGEPIDLRSTSETSPFLTTFLERHAIKQKQLAHSWMFFLVLDTRLQLFIPLLKVFGKGMQCMGCRLSPVMGGNCSHVESCLLACQAIHAQQRASSGVGFLNEIGIAFNRDDSDSDTGNESLLDDEFQVSSSDDGDNDVHNQSVRDPEVYYPTTLTRRILPCPGEINNMREIARRLDQVPPGEYLALDDRETVSCHTCGNVNTKPRYPGYKREVVLFTLAQGSPKIDVYDWYCDKCNERRIFTGKNSGVFPARKKICYTTELMYLLLEMTCSQALSFRTAYRITRLFERSPDIARRRMKFETSSLGDEGKRSRRRTNEAFRAFVKHLDTSSACITEKLYSCDTCEVPLSPQDCEELKIDPQSAIGMKRLKAVVIDGTAAGILTKLPDYDRNTTVCPPAKGGLGAVYLLSKPKHRKTLSKFLDMLRDHLRNWKSNMNRRDAANESNGLDSSHNLLFWLRNPTKANLRGVLLSKSELTEKESQMIQLYIDQETCFCPQQARVSSRHTTRCSDARNLFSKAAISPEVHDVFRQLFAVTQYTIPGSNSLLLAERPAPTSLSVHGHSADSESESDTETDEGRHTSGTLCGAYIQLLLSDLKQNTQFIECTIALLRFLLMEHVSMPYVGRLFLTSMIMGENTDNERNNPGEGSLQDTARGVGIQDELGQGDHLRTDGEHGEDGHHMRDGHHAQDVEHASNVRNVRNMQNVQHAREDRHLHASQNSPRHNAVEEHSQTARPDDGRQRQDINNVLENGMTRGPEHDDDEDDVEITSSMDSMMSFKSGSVTFHKQFIESLDAYMACLHFQENGRVQNVPQDCLCLKRLKEATVRINEISPVLGAFAREFLKLKRPLHIPEICFGNAVLDLLRHHMEEAEAFFKHLRNSLPEECELYWRNFASPKESSISNLLNEQTQDPAMVPSNQEQETEGDLTRETEEHQTTESIPPQNDIIMRDMTQATPSDQGIGLLHQPQSKRDLAADELRESQESGICFPGRRSVRPSIIFQTKDVPNCSKNYKTSKSHSPGLLTVQCACDAPKLIGFVVMTQAESVALALSAILTHFGVPPRAVFYDNACNLFTSILLRVPWLLGQTRLAVDRFH